MSDFVDPQLLGDYTSEPRFPRGHEREKLEYVAAHLQKDIDRGAFPLPTHSAEEDLKRAKRDARHAKALAAEFKRRGLESSTVSLTIDKHPDAGVVLLRSKLSTARLAAYAAWWLLDMGCRSFWVSVGGRIELQMDQDGVHIREINA